MREGGDVYGASNKRSSRTLIHGIRGVRDIEHPQTAGHNTLKLARISHLTNNHRSRDDLILAGRATQFLGPERCELQGVSRRRQWKLRNRGTALVLADIHDSIFQRKRIRLSEFQAC